MSGQPSQLANGYETIEENQSPLFKILKNLIWDNVRATWSLMPTNAQLGCLYRISYQLTYLMFQPIHLICVDGPQNLFILAGQNEEIEFEITPDGKVL